MRDDADLRRRRLAQLAKPGAGEKNRYKDTLNLPQTAFPMQANLIQTEPASINRWAGMRLYDAIRPVPLEERAHRPRVAEVDLLEDVRRVVRG